MSKILISDLSRVLLFPKDSSYVGSLNALAKKLSADDPYYLFWDHFRFNDDLLDSYKALGMSLYLYTSEFIQEHPSMKDKLINFDGVISALKDGIPKNDSKSYVILAEKLNVKPNEILYIDDSLTNIKAAEEANINSYLYINNELFKKIFLKRLP